MSLGILARIPRLLYSSITYVLFGTHKQSTIKETTMVLADTLTAQLAAIQTGETAVLTAALTQAFNDGVSSVASPTGDVTAAQEQIDIAAAVSSATAPLNTQISGLQLSLTQEQALLASVQSACSAIIAALTPAPAPAVPAS